MDKDKLKKIFSRACLDMAMFIDIYMRRDLDKTATEAAPLFEETGISDINEWWAIDDHPAGYASQLIRNREQNPAAYGVEFEKAIAELQKNEELIDQFRDLITLADINDDYLKFIPHRAEYAKILTETDGFRELQGVCAQMPNVTVTPLVTVDPDKNALKSAFCLAIHVLSTDNKPLLPKFRAAGRKGVFKAAARRIMSS